MIPRHRIPCLELSALIRFIFLFLLLGQSCVFAEAPFVRIYGTFIQPWLYTDWNDEQWEQELSALKSIGIEAIIVQWSAVYNAKDAYWETCYPSRIPNTRISVDSVEPLLKHAAKHGFKVYLGLGRDADWWNWNLSNEAHVEKFMNSMQMSARFAREIYRIYQPKYPDVFAGFYCYYEIWNHKDWNHELLRNVYAVQMASGFNILIRTLDTIAPELPLLFSPFATVEDHATLENTRAFYERFLQTTNFRKQDGMLPMDNVGGGGQSLETVEKWSAMYAEAIRKVGGKLNCYANVENFVQSREFHIHLSGGQSVTTIDEDDYFGSAPLDRFLKQLKIAEKHASKIFCFSYSHYYSPVNNIPGFHEALLHYRSTGKCVYDRPDAPSALLFSEVNVDIPDRTGKIKVLKIAWEGVSDNYGICRVNLYKNKKIIVHQFAIRKPSEESVSELDCIFYPDFRIDDADYRLGFVNVWGNETITKPFKIDLQTERIDMK